MWNQEGARLLKVMETAAGLYVGDNGLAEKETLTMQTQKGQLEEWLD